MLHGTGKNCRYRNKTGEQNLRPINKIGFPNYVWEAACVIINEECCFPGEDFVKDVTVCGGKFLFRTKKYGLP